MASQPIYELRIDPEAAGARTYAYRCASYIKDAEYIHRMTVREHGPRFAPTVETIRAMQADHRRKRERFAAQSRSLVKADPYSPENDNGEDWRPRSLIGRRRRCSVGSFALRGELPLGARIISAVADAYCIPLDDMTNGKRDQRSVNARFVATRLLSEQTLSDGRRRFQSALIAKMMDRHVDRVRQCVSGFEARAAKNADMTEVYEAVKAAL